jgi:hypothetical protein
MSIVGREFGHPMRRKNIILPSASGGGGGSVNSIVAGSGVTVDNTDPANPVVSAATEVVTLLGTFNPNDGLLNGAGSAITNADGTTGDTYRVTGAPTPPGIQYNFVTGLTGSGLYYTNNDFIMKSGATWIKIDNTELSEVSDEAYDEATWEGVTDLAPSKNAVRDQIEAMLAVMERRTHQFANAPATLAGVQTIDVGNVADTWFITLTEDITSWNFTNLPAAGRYRDIFIVINQVSPAKNVVSPASLTAGSAWIVSAVNGSFEILGLRVFDTGTYILFPSGVLV